MKDLFGTEYSGPTREQLRQDEIDRAKARERTIRAQAVANQNKGIVQLFSANNPALNVPGNNSGGTS